MIKIIGNSLNSYLNVSPELENRFLEQISTQNIFSWRKNILISHFFYFFFQKSIFFKKNLKFTDFFEKCFCRWNFFHRLFSKISTPDRWEYLLNVLKWSKIISEWNGVQKTVSAEIQIWPFTKLMVRPAKPEQVAENRGLWFAENVSLWSLRYSVVISGNPIFLVQCSI